MPNTQHEMPNTINAIDPKTPNPILKSPKSKSMAFWLCLLVGPFGLHRLYVGKIFSGLCMLIPSLVSSVWFYKQYIELSEILKSALSDPNPEQELNHLNDILTSTAAKIQTSSTPWDNLLSWITVGLLIWTLADLIKIGAGKFTDKHGKLL